MHITRVTQLLASAGLEEPVLDALRPNIDNYSALFFQPCGNIEASAIGVRNRDRALAQEQFGKFLAKAHELRVDLAVTPEYSLPWEVVEQAIMGGSVPEPGKIWALGCESIRYADLEALSQRLAPTATVLYETLEPDGQKFLDPLAYVFVARKTDGSGTGLVVLVQFKTYPMGDPNHFEITNLQRGNTVYEFGGTAQSLRLVSLICSDSFAFLDTEAGQVYDRALIIHIQLNEKPRHPQYRLYRDRLFKLQGDSTELICLNWAKDICEWSGAQQNYWRNISASAWYLKPDKFDKSDATLTLNHQRGLYYTWFKSMYVHALFFNFDPAIFLIEATKVAHLNVAGSVSRRRGPQIAKRFTWDIISRNWTEQLAADDGFLSILNESGDASGDLKQLADANPFAAERVLALSAGSIEHRIDWHSVQHLDSCALNTAEVIHRVTFCQDTDPAASSFRLRRLRRCANLWAILKAETVPPSLADIKGGFRLEWSITSPHQNLVSVGGERATAIYMSEDSSEAEVEMTFKMAAENLHRSSSNADESLTAKQRLAIWFRESGNLRIFDPHRFVKIDQTNAASEFDIGRQQ